MPDKDVIDRIIDPPVSQYNSKEEIQVWLSELSKMDDVEAVRLCIEEAEGWLDWIDNKGV